MRDMRVHLEKLRSDAADCALVSQRATDLSKRELFARLSEHLSRLAAEVERAMVEQEDEGNHGREPAPHYPSSQGIGRMSG
jgi:hypothetical protein